MVMIVVERQDPIAFAEAQNSTLFIKIRGGDHDFITAGCVAEGDKLARVEENITDDKLPYYEFADETHRMTGAEFFAHAPAREMPTNAGTDRG